MSEGMYVELDSFTAADREMLKDLQVREAPRRRIDAPDARA
jgi:hypothetical protein